MLDTPDRPSRRTPRSIDQRQAMHTAATRMCRDYATTFSIETIEEFLYSSYDEFAVRAVISNYLPLLAERFARQRLKALSKIAGHSRDGKPVVLFVCTHNSSRSQMAHGFFTALAGDHAIAWSAGSDPSNTVDADTIAAMAERGIDITGEYPKPWTAEIIEAADVIVTMGCGDACPILAGRRYENWKLDDPAGRTPQQLRRIRDGIEARVRKLLAELHIEPREPHLVAAGGDRR